MWGWASQGRQGRQPGTQDCNTLDANESGRIKRAASCRSERFGPTSAECAKECCGTLVIACCGCSTALGPRAPRAAQQAAAGHGLGSPVPRLWQALPREGLEPCIQGLQPSLDSSWADAKQAMPLLRRSTHHHRRPLCQGGSGASSQFIALHVSWGQGGGLALGRSVGRWGDVQRGTATGTGVQ